MYKFLIIGLAAVSITFLAACSNTSPGSTGLRPVTGSETGPSSLPGSTGLRPVTGSETGPSSLPGSTGLRPVTGSETGPSPLPGGTGLRPVTDPASTPPASLPPDTVGARRAVPETVQQAPASSKSLPVGAVKSSNAGNIEIDLRLNEVKDNSIIFKVEMNTHSVDLDKFDLSALSQMRDDKGNQYSPLGWQGPPGGHHRAGELVFPLPPSVSKGETVYIELVIKDVAIPQRVFKWELK